MISLVTFGVIPDKKNHLFGTEMYCINSFLGSTSHVTYVHRSLLLYTDFIIAPYTLCRQQTMDRTGIELGS